MIDHEISMSRRELQEAWDASSNLCARLQEALDKTRQERDEARRQRDDLLSMARYVIKNNPILFAGSSLESCVSSVDKSVTNPSQKK